MLDYAGEIDGFLRGPTITADHDDTFSGVQRAIADSAMRHAAALEVAFVRQAGGAFVEAGGNNDGGCCNWALGRCHRERAFALDASDLVDGDLGTGGHSRVQQLTDQIRAGRAGLEAGHVMHDPHVHQLATGAHPVDHQARETRFADSFACCESSRPGADDDDVDVFCHLQCLTRA